MNPNSLPIRSASKLILATPDAGILFTRGQSGRWNLPGGGIEPGETALDAMHRETIEELGLDIFPYCGPVRALGRIVGLVTDKFNNPFIAEWYVHSANLKHDITPWLRPGDDVEGIETAPILRIPAHPRVTRMSKIAVAHAR